MPGPITIERVQQEYKEHPYATPLEHVSNILNATEDKEQQDEEESGEES